MNMSIRLIAIALAVALVHWPGQLPGDDPIPPALPVPMPAAPVSDNASLSTQKQAQLRQLEQQIDELVHRIQAPPRTAPVPRPPDSGQWQASPAKSDVPPAVPVTPPAANPPMPEPIEQFLEKPTPSVPVSTAVKPQDVSAIPLPAATAGEIDRMSLANSLFATQQYAECLQILENVDAATLGPDDFVWKSYLTACCYRGTGDLKEATRRYREIVARPDADWTRDLAKWWLDHLQERGQLLERGQQLKATLQQTEEATHALTTGK